MTVISVATPMVSPSTVSATRSLCARMESTDKARLSETASIHFRHRFNCVSKYYLAPLLPRLEHACPAAVLDHERIDSPAVDLDSARLDLSRSVGYRVRQSDLGQQLVYPDTFLPAHAFGQRHGRQIGRALRPPPQPRRFIR